MANTGFDPTLGPSAAPAFLTAVVTLTSAQIKTLHSAPTPVIANPGAGKTILILAASAMLRFVTTAYTTGGASFALVYTSTPTMQATISGTTFLSAGASTNGAFRGSNEVATTAQSSNTGISASVSGAADPTLGDGTITLTIVYCIVAG